MPATDAHLKQLLGLVPEWTELASQARDRDGGAGGEFSGLDKDTLETFAFLKRLGHLLIYKKALALALDGQSFFQCLRDCYFLPLAAKMFKSNPSLRRFSSERRMDLDEQKSQALSLAVELAAKLTGVLQKQSQAQEENGFKVLLPAYVQSAVNNAVIDHIKTECHWERQTWQDAGGDDQGDDNPIERAPDDPAYRPEAVALSKEKVQYLNALKKELQTLLTKDAQPDPSLTVVDCIFGLGLTPHSALGEEMTMRECCERLAIDGETQPRKIARCQVLLDKGLDRVRDLLRRQMPNLVSCWQKEVNVNSASRRDLNHQLDLTEGEIERLIQQRQYIALDQLIERLVIKTEKLPLLIEKGAVAAFVPVDVNSATVRDIIDILGLNKELAQKLAAKRPFKNWQMFVDSKILPAPALEQAKQRGLVLKASAEQGQRPDLNSVDQSELIGKGIHPDKAEQIERGRPFATWAELEEFFALDQVTCSILRTHFRLQSILPNF